MWVTEETRGGDAQRRCPVTSLMVLPTMALYKNKGNKSDCGNYRDISLLSIVGKIFACILLNRLVIVSERNFPEEQCDFHPEWSTADVVSAMGQIKEKYIKQDKPLSLSFLTWQMGLTLYTGRLSGPFCHIMNAPGNLWRWFIYCTMEWQDRTFTVVIHQRCTCHFQWGGAVLFNLFFA